LRSWIGGALLGMAGLVRPMACFAVFGQTFMYAVRRRWATAASFAIASGLIVFAGLWLVQDWRHDALASFRYQALSPAAYDGHLLTWPFRSLLITPLAEHASGWRVVYIWIHVVAVIAACGALAWHIARQWRVGWRADARDLLAGPWLLGNTLFALCIGNVWGFECFHRFLIPAQPAMFWALRGILPPARWRWAWAAILVGSAVIATASVRPV
jgi:small-conductance mechanosensitive channel